jgi:general secretion pathway protein L
MEGAIIREGKSTLAELATHVPKSDVVLIIAASDVTLLELTIPPMPEAKLKLALPSLVEDQLMTDPADCVLMLGAKPEGESNKRHIAVAQRSWLQQLSASLFALGANHVKAHPAQLCLPLTKDQSSAALQENSQGFELVLRSGDESGIGMMLESDLNVDDALATLALLAPPGQVAVHVPSQLVADVQAAIKANPELAERLTAIEAKWSAIAKTAKVAGFNLMSGLNSAQTNRVQWNIWRWPLVLAAILFVVNVGALNYDYWNLKREAGALKNSMLQIYRSTFPKDTVVVFPQEQMRKNLEVAQRGSGQPSPDDFTLLLTQFGQAWSALAPDKAPKLLSIEFKDRALVLQIKGTMPQKELQVELDDKGLVLKKNNSEVWQVKVAK